MTLSNLSQKWSGFTQHSCGSESFSFYQPPTGKGNGNMAHGLDVLNHSQLYSASGLTFPLSLFSKRNDSRGTEASILKISTPLFTSHMSLEAHGPFEVSPFQGSVHSSTGLWIIALPYEILVMNK